MTLKDKGYRFGWNGKQFNWFHPADCQEDNFIDCTSMDDEHFEKLVRILMPVANDSQ